MVFGDFFQLYILHKKILFAHPIVNFYSIVIFFSKKYSTSAIFEVLYILSFYFLKYKRKFLLRFSLLPINKKCPNKIIPKKHNSCCSYLCKHLFYIRLIFENKIHRYPHNSFIHKKPDN